MEHSAAIKRYISKYKIEDRILEFEASNKTVESADEVARSITKVIEAYIFLD